MRTALPSPVHQLPSEEPPAMRRIDAHHHLWRYSAEEYGWIDDTMSPLRRDFLCEDLRAAMSSANVHAAVVVQARQAVEETEWLLRVAAECPEVAGVVGWAPLGERDVLAKLEKWTQDPKFVGLRHIVQAEAPGYLESDPFNAGISKLRNLGLTYDILIVERQMEETIRFVERHPNQAFVLDHLGKPRIAAGEVSPWRERLRELARHENVSCKISGMVTEADWSSWNEDTLRPYLDEVVAAFGPKRLMCGSDWPVCLLACGYVQWWQVLERYFAPFSASERNDIFGGNAIQFYGLDTK